MPMTTRDFPTSTSVPGTVKTKPKTKPKNK